MKGGDVAELTKWVKQLQVEKEKLLEEVAALCWYMRGGLQWSEAMEMSYLERKKAFEFVNGRLEKIKDHHFPVY